MSTDGFRIAVLISGSGSNLQAIINAMAAGEIPATIELVLSNRPEAAGLKRAQRAGIPTAVIDHRAYATREAYDEALAERLHALDPDLIVLAGFMRILTDGLVRAFTGRLINIHPSLLPAYRGLHTHERALAAGDSAHGCSVHYVIPALDAGPVIAQASVPIRADDTAETLQDRVQAMEHQLYPQVVRWIAEGRVRMEDDTVFMDNVPVTTPPCLSEAVTE